MAEEDFNLGLTNGLSLTTPLEQVTDLSGSEKMLAYLNSMTDQLLKSDYAGGNSQQAWTQDKPKDLTGNEFFKTTGRIDAHAKPATPPQGLTSTGLKTGSLTNGTSFTPDAEWNQQFEPRLASEVAPQMAQHPATAVKASANPWDTVAKEFATFNRYAPPTPSQKFKVTGDDAANLASKIIA